ncbi:aminopeptidase N-like [Leptopilina heterotoma]|uniref:aminopeptidase N-like n=1 Tax=Leptopilina heterotoma TaxID=63436 RepID=UPI001CA8E441|nr:aminopeptidase N-like [Leptopilina heterotoma]
MQEVLSKSKGNNNTWKVKEVMELYISQLGYPVINMSRNYTTGVITLSQECTVCSITKMPSKFFIPINFATSSSLNFTSTFASHWLRPDEKELIIEGIHPNDWVIFNIQSSAYYRVNYDKRNWEQIDKYLNSENFSRIHVLNRAQLLENAFWLFKTKKINEESLINLTSYMSREVDYIPWTAADDILLYFHTENVTFDFKKYTLNLVKALIKDAGVDGKENDDIFTVLKRFIGTYWSCALDKRHCSKVNW